jgi:hypothetical protein
VRASTRRPTTRTRSPKRPTLPSSAAEAETAAAISAGVLPPPRAAAPEMTRSSETRASCAAMSSATPWLK